MIIKIFNEDKTIWHVPSFRKGSLSGSIYLNPNANPSLKTFEERAIEFGEVLAITM